MVLFGAGTPATTTAGWVLLVAHAAFKAALFMVVGIIDHQTGTRDIRALPAARATAGAASRSSPCSRSASMAGVPLGAGFVAKELAYDALGDAPFAGERLVLAVVVAGSMLTVAYAVRFYWGAFVAPAPPRHARPAAASPPPPSSAFVAPAAVLAVVGVVLGVAPGVADRLATASLAGYGPPPSSVHLVAVARLRPAARAVGAHARRRRRAVRSPTAGSQPRAGAGERRSRAAPRCTSPCCAASASCRPA